MYQESVNGDNHNHLTSLMQNLTLSSNNYPGESSLSNQYTGESSLSNQYTGESSLSNQYTEESSLSNQYTGESSLYNQYTGESPLYNLYHMNNDHLVTGNNILGFDCNHRQHTGARSSSSSSNSNSNNISKPNYRNSITQLPASHPSITDWLWNDYFESSRHQERTRNLLEDIFRCPILVLLTPGGCSEFKLLLENLCDDEDVISGILDKIATYPPQILALTSCHKAAHKVIKKLIHIARRLPGVSVFPRAFTPNVVQLMSDQYGRDVIQECFVSLSQSMNETLFEEVGRHWREIAMTKYGCISLQDCINYMDSSPIPCYLDQRGGIVYAPSFKQRFLRTISHNAVSLALDLHGNYVLQRVFLLNYSNCNDIIATNLRPVYEILCTNQSGSYLVQQCSRSPFRVYVAEELLKSKKLAIIVQDAYGNYVIQTLLEETKKHDPLMHEKLCKKLLQDLNFFKNTKHGRNVANILKYQLKEDEAIENGAKKWQRKTRHHFQ